MDSLDDGVSKDLRMLLRSAPELVKHEGYITMWRTCGAYGTTGEGRTAQEIATPAFARAMARITCDVARLHRPHRPPLPRPPQHHHRTARLVPIHPHTPHPPQHHHWENPHLIGIPIFTNPPPRTNPVNMNANPTGRPTRPALPKCRCLLCIAIPTTTPRQRLSAYIHGIGSAQV